MQYHNSTLQALPEPDFDLAVGFQDMELKLKTKKSLPYVLAKKTIAGCLETLEEPDSLHFLENCLHPALKIFLQQVPEKLDIMYARYIEEMVADSLNIMLNVSHDVFVRNLNILDLIFSHDDELYFYNAKKRQTISMYNNYNYDAPHNYATYRVRMAKAFNAEGGFAMLLVRVFSSGQHPWLGFNTTFHLFQAMDDAGSAVLPTTRQPLVAAVMDTLMHMTDEQLKSDGTDSLPRLMSCICRLCSLDADDAKFFTFWLDFTAKLMNSKSLLLKLFAWDQVSEIIREVAYKRPLAMAYRVEGAGLPSINGVYTFNRIFPVHPDSAPVECGMYVREPTNNAEQPVTLFRCLMKHGKKYWFISKTDTPPGTSKDTDYYEHRNKDEFHRDPPLTGWDVSQSGVGPAPTLTRIDSAEHDRDEAAFNPTAALQRWAHEHNLLEHGFGPSNIKAEIVSRAQKLLKFMAESRAITAEHLQLLWRAAMNNQDTIITESVFSLLSVLSPLLDEEPFAALMTLALDTLLQDGALPNVNKVALFVEKIVAEVPFLAASLSEASSNHLLSLVWALYKHPHFEALKGSATVQDLLSRCLSRDVSGAMTMLRIDECLASLSAAALKSVDETAVSRVVRTLLFLISRQTGLTHIDDALQAGLTATLEAEIVRFVTTNRPRLAAGKVEAKWFSAGLAERLQVLRQFFGVDCSVKMPLRLVDSLWQTLSVNRFELDELLQFFVRGVEEVKLQLHSMLKDDDSIVMFKKYLCSKEIDWATCSAGAFDCFLAFFETNYNRHFCHEGDELLGFDSLWRIALSIQSEAATKAAMELLLKTYEDKALRDATFFGSVVEVAFAHLDDNRVESLASGSLSAERQLCVSRCIDLLSCAISRYRGSSGLSPAHAVCGTMSRIGISVQHKKIRLYICNSYSTSYSNHYTEKGTEGETHVTAHPLMTMLQLKEKLCRVIPFPDVTNTRIDNPGKTLSKLAPSTRLVDTDISDGCQISAVYTIRTPSTHYQNNLNSNNNSLNNSLTLPDEADDVDEYASVRRNVGSGIAENEAQFECLIALCEAVKEPKVLSKIWTLLMVIPTQSEKEMQLRGACDRFLFDPEGQSVDWDALLGGASTSEMTYMLQILDHLMQPSEEAALEGSLEYSQKLQKMFLQSGGFTKLLRVLCSITVGENEIKMIALSTALHILHHLLFGTDESIFPPTSLFAELEASSAVIVEKLLAVASDAAEVANMGVVSEAFAVLRYLLKSPDATAQLILNPQSKTLLAFCLRSASEQVRTISSDFAIFVGESQPVVFNWLIEEIESVDVDDALCGDTFRALCVLLNRLSRQPGAIDFPQLAAFLSDKILQFTSAGPPSPVSQTKSKAASTENLPLNGYLGLLEILVRHHHPVVAETPLGAQLVGTFFREFLFALPQGSEDRPPICRTESTRSKAFGVLAAFVANQPASLGDLLTDLARLTAEGKGQVGTQFGLQVSGEVKKSNIAYSGLKNQGCTCYMNSLLQQLYMCTSFREAILRAPIRQMHRATTSHLSDQDLVGRHLRIEQNNKNVSVHITGYDATTGEHQFFQAPADGNGQRQIESRNIRNVISQPLCRSRIIWEDELEIATADEAALRVLEQLQRTFCYMQHSNRRFFDPVQFVEACKSLNMNFSVYQQNDAAEFYDQLLDRLEISTKGTTTGRDVWSSVFQQDVFGMQVAYQKIPKDCPAYVSNREECGHWQGVRTEPSMRVELQVAGKDKIEDSLSEYFVDEYMEGDNAIKCDVCDKKKDTTRRKSLSSPPNTLVLHLKRFDLDFQTFETVKLNSRLEFPTRINILRYTKEGAEMEERRLAAQAEAEENGQRDASPTTPPRRGGAGGGSSSSGGGGGGGKDRSLQYEADEAAADPDPADYEYELQGVLVHSGIAQGGHYYSYARDPSDPERWYKLDDDEVSPFNPDNIGFQCFGGPASYTPGAAASSTDEDRASNALILFYNKCIPRKAPVPAAPAPAPAPAPHADSDATSSATSGSPDGSAPASPTVSSASSAPPPPAQASESPALRLVDGYEAFLGEVRRSNLQHVLLQYLFDQGLHAFVLQLVSAAVESEAPNMPHLVTFATSFILDVLLHFRDRSKKDARAWLRVLGRAFELHPKSAGQFLEMGKTRKQYLLSCPDASARKFVADLTVLASAAIAAAQRAQRINAEVLSKINFCLVEEINMLLVLACAEPKYADELIGMVRDLAKSPLLCVQMLKARYITRLAFFVDSSSPEVEEIREMLTAEKTRWCNRDDYVHLAQSVLEAIAALLGVPQMRRASLVVEPARSHNNLSGYSNVSIYEPLELTSEASEAFGKIFAECASSREGMSADDVVAYAAAVGQPLTKAEVAKKFGLQPGGFFSLDAYLSYQAEKTIPTALWHDLRVFGFRDDLTREKTDPPPRAPNPTSKSGWRDCAKVLSSFSFYDSGLFLAESSCLAVAACVCTHDLDASTRIIHGALLRLLQRVNADGNYSVSQTTSGTMRFIEALLRIEDEYSLARMSQVLRTDQVGMMTIVHKQLASRTPNSFYFPLKLRYIESLSALYRDPRLHASIQQLAEDHADVMHVKRMLRPRADCLLSELDDEMVRSATVIVDGAGTPEVNGEYSFVEVMKDAGLYRRRGMCLGVEMDFHVYRCKMQHGSLQWFISATEVGRSPGTDKDRDFYIGKSTSDEDAVFGRCLPPYKFASDRHAPAPTITFRFPEGSPYFEEPNVEAVPESDDDDDHEDSFDSEGDIPGFYGHDSSGSLDNSGYNINNIHNYNNTD